VPRTGIEPALRCRNKILSLARLPIPPSRQIHCLCKCAKIIIELELQNIKVQSNYFLAPIAVSAALDIGFAKATESIFAKQVLN
jgi:hypothetical protein